MTDQKVLKDLRLLAEEVALGSGASATGDKTVALGINARARLDKSWNVSGLPLIKKDDGESDQVLEYSGALAVILWKERDLKAATDYLITLPAGGLFFPVEVGVVITTANSVSGQPTVRFGYQGTPAGYLAATLCSGLTAAGTRNRWTSLVTYTGKDTLYAGVTSAASATELKGRFYMQGMWIENE